MKKQIVRFAVGAIAGIIVAQLLWAFFVPPSVSLFIGGMLGGWISK